MKTKIVVILIITILVNVIFPNFLYATDTTVQDIYDGQASRTDALGELESGEVTIGGSKQAITSTPHQGGAAAHALMGIFLNIPFAFNIVTTIFARSSSGDVIYITDADGNQRFNSLTIEDMVFGRVKLLDIDYFNFNEGSNNANDVIKDSVARWYYSVRNLSIVILLVILIYIGIRMAMSTIASDKATYKKMFSSWMVSFVLVFVIHYIILFALAIAKQLISIIEVAASSTGSVYPTLSFESEILNNAFSLTMLPGWSAIPYFLIYCVLTFYIIRFLFLYLKRLISTGFLILIAPLVTITYSLDKMGDGEAQAFTIWFKEIIVNIFVQVVHALIYVIFMYTAGAIAIEAPILTIIFFMALSRAEKMIKQVFGMREQSSIKSMSETLSMSRISKAFGGG